MARPGARPVCPRRVRRGGRPAGRAVHTGDHRPGNHHGAPDHGDADHHDCGPAHDLDDAGADDHAPAASGARTAAGRGRLQRPGRGARPDRHPPTRAQPHDVRRHPPEHLRSRTGPLARLGAARASSATRHRRPPGERERGLPRHRPARGGRRGRLHHRCRPPRVPRHVDRGRQAGGRSGSSTRPTPRPPRCSPAIRRDRSPNASSSTSSWREPRKAGLRRRSADSSLPSPCPHGGGGRWPSPARRCSRSPLGPRPSARRAVRQRAWPSGSSGWPWAWRWMWQLTVPGYIAASLLFAAARGRRARRPARALAGDRSPGRPQPGRGAAVLVPVRRRAARQPRHRPGRRPARRHRPGGRGDPHHVGRVPGRLRRSAR